MRILILILCIIISINGFAFTYSVKSGDTLTTIAHEYLGRYIYGSGGGLQKILSANSNLKNPDLIFPGQELEIPGGEKKLASVVEEKEELRPPQVVAPFLPPNRWSQIELSPLAYYSRLEGVELSNNSKASLISKLNSGLDVTWRQIWNAQFQTFETIGLRSETFLSNVSSTLGIENRTQKRTRLGFGSVWNFSPRWNLQGEILMEDELYYRGSPGGQSIMLETVPIPQIHFSIGYRILELAPFFIATKAAAGFGAASSTPFYSVKPLSSYRAEFELGQNIHSLSASCSFFYQTMDQDTSILDINRTDIGIGILFKWELGK